MRAVLNALADDSRLNVISSPSVMVLNNQTASIDVGDEVPITTQQQQSTTGVSNVVNNIEYRNTGVLLIGDTARQHRRIGHHGCGARSQPGVDRRARRAASRRPSPSAVLSTAVAVQSGQTVVLGGLIREQKAVVRSGIPGLYNMPIIGPLFGTTSDEQVRTELVVLITPRAVQDAADAAQVTEEFRSKMESLRPLSIPEGRVGEGKVRQKIEDGEPQRSWPRVGPDEGARDPKPTESRSAPSVTVSEVAQDWTQPAADGLAGRCIIAQPRIGIERGLSNSLEAPVSESDAEFGLLEGGKV